MRKCVCTVEAEKKHAQKNVSALTRSRVQMPPEKKTECDAWWQDGLGHTHGMR